MSGITPPLSTTYHYSAEADWLIPILIGALPIIITIIVIIVLACRVKKHAANPVHFCPRCGQMANTKNNFCKRCGFPLLSQPMPLQPQNNFYIQPTSPLAPPKKHRTGMIIAIILLIVEVIAVVCSSLLLYFNYQNAFDAEISNADYDQYGQDYTFTYISDETGVTVTITPTYDIKEFSFTICYYGTSITDTYSEQYEFEFSQAKVPILIFIPAETMNEELWGDFSYARMMHVYGKKQNKNIDNPDHQVHH